MNSYSSGTPEASTAPHCINPACSRGSSKKNSNHRRRENNTLDKIIGAVWDQSKGAIWGYTNSANICQGLSKGDA